jgi:hypothetical protein
LLQYRRTEVLFPVSIEAMTAVRIAKKSLSPYIGGGISRTASAVIVLHFFFAQGVFFFTVDFLAWDIGWIRVSCGGGLFCGVMVVMGMAAWVR